MRIDKNEALRYMGYKGQSMDEGLDRLVEECLKEIKDISREGFTYQIFDMDRSSEGIRLSGTTMILRGEAIGKHLAKSYKCAVMAATLGLEADRRIAYYGKFELTKSLVLDACADAAVEALCDEVEGEIRLKAENRGFDITSRFSPGYGDFPIELQKDIVRVLGTYQRIGLSVNESSIMVPRKSVTAVIGLQGEKCSIEEHKCSSCKDIYCLYRKDRDDNE